jgi:hypothetical protein
LKSFDFMAKRFGPADLAKNRPLIKITLKKTAGCCPAVHGNPTLGVVLR